MTKEKIITSFLYAGIIIGFIVGVGVAWSNNLHGMIAVWGIGVPIFLAVAGIITGIGYLIGCAVEKNSWKE